MSIDLNWETLTTGPDGAELAERIRLFIHEKFQTVPLPRFIRSVEVLGFDFGTIPPDLELKDITDPLPEFYDAEDDSDLDSDDDQPTKRPRPLRTEIPADAQDLTSPFLGAGLNYFQSHLGGTQTPLAAVAGHWMPEAGHVRNPSLGSISISNHSEGGLERSPSLHEKSSVSTLTSTRPPTRDLDSAVIDEPVRKHEPRVDDVQAVFRIRYAGDIRLNLTAEILLDYPMPSFVGIPLKLNITGLSFDGVGVAAKIRKRVHFCFLSPDDALAAVGPDEIDGTKGRLGGLLQEVKVESEIGERDGGKQSLKNVGKVEKFVLEQVRRIFDDEFVYPSFWTFLV